MKKVYLVLLLLLSANAFAVNPGPYYASGKIVSLMASGTDPALRLTGNISPDLCNGGNHGWLYFKGSAEERNRTYASALALSLTGKAVAVYTNSDGEKCRIDNIQVTIN